GRETDHSRGHEERTTDGDGTAKEQRRPSMYRIDHDKDDRLPGGATLLHVWLREDRRSDYDSIRRHLLQIIESIGTSSKITENFNHEKQESKPTKPGPGAGFCLSVRSGMGADARHPVFSSLRSTRCECI